MELNTAPLSGVATPVITIGVVDDFSLVVSHFSDFINGFAGLQVILQAEGGKDVLQQLASGSPLPDILLLDVSMQPMDGLQTALELLRHYPSLKILAFTSAPEDLVCMKMLAAGCYGYLYKGANPKEIESQIREVYAMEQPPELPQEVREKLAKVLPEWLCFDQEERDRLQLYCQGYDQQVAARVLERRLLAVEDQQTTLVGWLRQLLSMITGLFRRRKKYLIFTDGHRKISIAIKDIVKISAAKDYVRVHIVGNSTSRLYLSTLREVEAAAVGTDLLRVNRSTIVNRKHIGYVERKELIGIAGEEVALQKKYAELFLSAMEIEK